MGERLVARPRELRALSSRCCRCEHLLRAKESHDAFDRVRSTHVERFCGCGRGRATPGPYSARDGAFGWASVARPELFSFTVPLQTLCDGEKIPGRVLGRDQITCEELFCGCVIYVGRSLRARVLIEMLRILMGGRSVAHLELRALFDVHRCDHFLGTE